MKQNYKIDRLRILGYNNVKKLKEVGACRYLAKSQLAKCSAKSKKLIYLNFRGSRFKDTNFTATTFLGCDFWGASFNKCNFKNAHISDCVFMACKFKNCNFEGAKIEYTTIVNTNLSECKKIEFENSVDILKQYPECQLEQELIDSLDKLKENPLIRKCKLLHLPGNKYNKLNLYLLQKKFTERELPPLLLGIADKSKSELRNITTYKKLENTLKHDKRVI